MVSLEELAGIGARAKAFKDSEPYQAAFDAVKINILTGIVDSEVEDSDRREHLHKLYQALIAVDSQLQNTIDSGDIAQEELNEH